MVAARVDKITEIFAFIATEADGREGVVAAMLGGMMVPLVGADQARVKSLLPLARQIAQATGRQVQLARFSVREDLEVLEA